jgi:hypothetical protein
MDSADGHPMGPEPAAETEQLAREGPQVWLVWALWAVAPLEPASPPDETERAWLVGPPALQGSMAPLCSREEPASAVTQVRLQSRGPEGWWEIQPASAGRQAGVEIPPAQRPPVPPVWVWGWRAQAWVIPQWAQAWEPGPQPAASLSGGGMASPRPPASPQRQRCRHCSEPARPPRGPWPGPPGKWWRSSGR